MIDESRPEKCSVCGQSDENNVFWTTRLKFQTVVVALTLVLFGVLVATFPEQEGVAPWNATGDSD